MSLLMLKCPHAHIHCLVIHGCPTFCDPQDCSPPGSSVHGSLQARDTGVGCRFLLQGILRTQESKPHLLRFLHWQADYWPLAPPWKVHEPHDCKEIERRSCQPWSPSASSSQVTFWFLRAGGCREAVNRPILGWSLVGFPSVSARYCLCCLVVYPTHLPFFPVCGMGSSCPWGTSLVLWGLQLKPVHF